jgi:hypothetical protein
MVYLFATKEGACITTRYARKGDDDWDGKTKGNRKTGK